ncbi:hypothetical protein KUCAC02_031226 [Chaenocephalus aceratus]|uniref:Uncharacterized protein n=1 Tax=Chaenocephalus aceratus TaxID=36190 RepID=A0ACB9XN92_CHAAC|nr:hypothetical protein KUCAC02_031226 [Chaenocephalus aceratus]
MCQWQGGKGLYMQLNATAPILALYANPEACLKKDFRVKRSSVAYLVQMLSSPKDHGWGQDIEVLVLLYSLAHGLSLSVDQNPPPAAAGGQESPGHHLRDRIAAQLSASVQMAPHLREHDYI